MNVTRPSEEAFIRALQAGHASAFTQLYEAYSPALYGALLKLVGDQALAEDLLQDSFVKIWLNRHHYTADKGRLYTWLLAITRHVAMDELKARKNRLQVRVQVDERSSKLTDPATPEGLLHQSIFSLLSPPQRQIVELVYRRGYTKPEIAEELNLPLGTVKTRFRRAIQTLQGVFSQDIGHYHGHV